MNTFASFLVVSLEVDKSILIMIKPIGPKDTLRIAFCVVFNLCFFSRLPGKIVRLYCMKKKKWLHSPGCIGRCSIE